MQGIPLNLIDTGEKGVVYDISAGQKASKRLYEMGFNRGSELKVVKNDRGPIIVSLAGTKIALGRGLAQKILISQ
ncbi:FeoA family protein [Anaerosalibacter sp. Marseille-P3206]|uniref:FeoA family protein n=1 Tax=Anaerosalibacter sp. Marseille-P3206 TaxID=1871005 RepID=UPI000984B10E|nr:FeoA domain-containing protein [Anaerosalibacter sp. Marseille-P3206]